MQSSPNEVKETKTLPDIFWTSKRVIEMSDKWVEELKPEEGFKTIMRSFSHLNAHAIVNEGGAYRRTRTCHLLYEAPVK